MSQAGARGKVTILLVEDNQFVLDSIGTHLESLGYGVFTAKDGPDAIQILDTAERVNLLLTDVVMPRGIGGQELAREAQRRQAGIRVIMFSGYPRDQLIEDGRISKDTPLLSKPFGLETLERAIRNIIGNGHST